MRKYKKTLCACTIFSLILVNILLGTSNEKMSSSILLQNVEALAAGEDEGIGEYGCYGEGLVDCPSGEKVEIYINNLRLDFE